MCIKFPCLNLTSLEDYTGNTTRQADYYKPVTTAYLG